MIIKKLKGKLNKIKICAVFTGMCFVISTLGANLYAVPMSENTNQKYEDVFNKASSISNEYGKITSSIDAKSDITVINIQDLHCHPQTQRNISKIIEEIANKYNLKKIYVEGGYGDIDTSWLNQIKDENIRKKVIERLVEDGLLTGSEYYKITSNNKDVALKGIDEEKIHKDNVKRLSWLIQQQDKYKLSLEKINNEIKMLEKRYVNNRNKRFNEDIDKYLSNKTDSKQFYKQLTKYVRDINNNPDKYNNITAIRLEQYPNICKFIALRKISKNINIKEVTQQLQIVINDLKNRLPYGVYTKLLKETENLSNGQKVVELITLFCKKEGINLTKYQDLNFFLESNYITRNINPIDLVQEERQLISEIRKALSYNYEEYEITFILDFYKYFENYLEYKLTDADWKYFETTYDTFRQLYGKYAVVDRIKEIEQDFVNINKYYTINDQRNNIFVKKLLENENIKKTNDRTARTDEEILKESKEVIIAVTGGFHSSELGHLLASNDVNTVVITPKIFEDIKRANEKYIELIEVQSKVTSQALSYTIASCTTDVDKQKILLSIVRDIVGDNTETLEKVLGKKVDLSILTESAADIKTKKEIRTIIERTIEQVLKAVPQKGMEGVFIPNIDEIMLTFSQQLVKQGVFFSEGTIFDIESSKLNGQDLKGIPAEIYSRMLPALQQALFKVATKTEEITEEDETAQDIQDLYEDTGATENSYLYLEDINNNPELFIELLKDSVINKKLIVLRVFRNTIDIDKLDREQQKKLYNDIRDMFFKIYTDKPLYEFISQPENKEFLQYDIHFFLLEILENSFMHGNKGFDKPIYIYMDLNEQNEINNLKIYNKNSQEDDNFQMRFIRMRLALLGGQHKSNVLMKQNPYRTFEVDDNFKEKFYKVSSEIKSSYDKQAAISLKENHEFISYFSIVVPFKDKNKFFYFLHETAHIWEEFVFRTLPITLAVLPITAFLPVPAILALFIISQILFIKAHGGSFKEQLKQKFLPTTLLSAPYLLTILFVPNIPTIILSTIIGIALHKYFNLALKSKLNIFDDETIEETITLSDFLANKQTVDLSNIQEQQLLAKVLDEKELSEQDAIDIISKINIDDISQSNNLLEAFYKQRVVSTTNKRTLISVLAKKTNVNNSNQLLFLKNILLSDKYSLSVDEAVASILVEKLDFNNKQHVDFLIDYLKLKGYHRKFQNVSLNNKIINKIDINNSNQIKLLGLFSFIDDKLLYSLFSKFDFSNKNTLQNLFKTVLQLNLPQRQETFNFILNKLDLKNNIDFTVLQNIISNTDYINVTVINNIFAHLDFNDKKHLNLIKNIINNKKNIEITIIESFKKHIDINNPAHTFLLKDLIENFFRTNTIDSKVVFFERIKEILQKINIEQLNDTEKYVFKVFTDNLLLNIQKVINSIQNENIKTKNDKIIVFLGFNDKIFDELIELTNVLSEQEKALSEQALTNLKDVKKQISFIQDMTTEKITIKDFAEKFNFRFSQQTPNTYIDSNRYSFTKLLSLFPENILKHKVKKLSPTYIIEKEDFDSESLKNLLIKFNAYMDLLDENEYVINKFGDVSSFDSQFEDVIKHIKSMITDLSVFNPGDAAVYRRILEEILEKINNNETTIEEQKKFSRAGKFQKTGTISNLINQIHQTANLDFVLNIRETARFSLRTAQNVFVAKDDRAIAAYNLSQKPMDPEIKRLLLMLIENPDFTTTDRNSHIFIKDNIFLWNGLLGDHSARVLIDFNRDSRNIFIDFSEGERSNESRSRILALQKILSNFGFTIELYNNNNSLTATVNKDTDLTNSTDICDMAQKAMIALSNAASLYRTNIPKQVIDAATLGIMDIYKKSFFVSAIENNIIKTNVNKLSFFNRILSYLQLSKIPFTEPGMISYIKVGPFFKRQIKTLGQNTINKYINQPIEQAFANGYLKVNKNGVLERNNEYNPILSVANKLNIFLDKEIGDSQEIEMLNQGAILSQITEHDLNLKTCGQLGRYILKTGYIKLSDGSLNDNIQGEFLSVKMLVDKNGVVRYSESELVGLPEFMKNETGRTELTSEQLQYVLSKQGYDIITPEKLTDTEILNYRIKLQEDISSSNMPVAYGILMSTPEETDNVVGIVGKTGDIFIDKFASPENVDISSKNKISLFAGGSYSSHAGIVLREYHKTAMIVNDSQIMKDGRMKITFYQSKDNVTRMGRINTQEIDETEIILQDKDIVVVDLTSNRLILYPNSIFKNILLDLQVYIDNQDVTKVKEFLEEYRDNKLIDKIIEYIYYQSGDNEWIQDILSEYSEYNIEENTPSQNPSRYIEKKKLRTGKFLHHTANGKAYKFGEEDSLDKSKVGTKAANQAKIYLNINQLKQDTGVTNVASPNGIAIDYSILKDILGQNYIRLYEQLENLIGKKEKTDSDYDKIQELLTQITELINDISNSKIKDYIGKNNLRAFKNIKIIVRSSGVGEDSQENSAAGIAESYGNIEYENISNAIRSCLCSFFSKKAIDYMLETGKLIKPAVLIEEWIEADKSGIMMSETSDGNRLIQIINGQGEDIVSGRINPYSFEIDINTREKIDGDYTSKESITGEQLEDLTKIMEWLEQVEGVPVDIEFVIKKGIIYIVQVRPITTLGYTTDEEDLEEPELEESEKDIDIIDEEEIIYDTEQETTYDFTNEINTESSDRSYTKTSKKQKKSKGKNKSKNKKSKGKNKSKNKKYTSSQSGTSTYSNNNDIRQPQGMTVDDVITAFTKLANSKDSFDKSLELSQQQIRDVLLRSGLTQQQIGKIDFSEGLPDYVITLLKNKNSQITGTTIDPQKSLFENLREHPILFSLALETFTRVYEKSLGDNATLGDLLSFIEQRYAKRLYEATCTDLRGYFGEIYLINTLIAGFIPDKRAGPIIIRPDLPTDNNIRGFDIYDIDRVKIQVKTGGSEIVHHHFSRYWFQPSNTTDGIIAIPVITTKNVKEHSFSRDDRVQGMDVTTETVTKFAHDFVSALHGIAYKRNNPAIRNIKLKDLIYNFKGFSTNDPMTVDDLLNLLNKNQISTIKKEKKHFKKDNEPIIDSKSGKINIEAVANQDIIVTINSEQTHILSVNDEQILLNEERKTEISKEEYSMYGIENVEYDDFGNITYIKFKEGVSLSNITIDGKPEGSKENNIAFSEQEIKGLNEDSQTQGYIDVYLDGDIDEICHLIKKAATEKKLIVFHLFEKGFNTSRLTPSQLLDVYKNAVSLISNRFQLSDIFSHPIDDSQYTDYGIDFFFEEILKNAFIRGNFGQFEEPIALYIKLDENKNLLGFSVYNKSVEGEIYKHKEALARASHFMFIGDSRSTDIMLNNPVREYKLDKKQINGTDFKKADVSFRDTIDMEKYQLEQNYKKSEENVSITDIALQSETTKKALHKKGVTKYTQQYLEQTGKQEQNLTFEERLKIEEQAKEYRFTMSGIFDGVKLEIFAFFSRNFISSHSKLPFVSKIAVHAIRLLSIGIGISFTIISFSVLPIGTAILSAIILSPLSIIISGATMHFFWNIVAVITNNKDWLLQSDRITIPTENAEENKGRTLTDEEKEGLELARIKQEEFYDSIYTYQPNPLLAKDVLEIFNKLTDAMFRLGLITEEEKSQYKLHYYYQPTSNAFTIRNSKDVFIFSQLLYEIDKKLKKDGKALTKDIVAAIISHELRHTIQENRNFEYKKRGRQFGVNKGSDKRMEYDADTGGLEILDMAGYNPKAMQELLSFFCETTEEGNYSLITLLDAHPNSKDRLKTVSSILESKDIAFMNMDKEEQPLSVKSIKNYFTFVASITRKILSLGYRNRIIRKIIINYMLSDKSKYFTNEEKTFLQQATNLQKNFIYELLFPQTKESKYYFTNLSEKEKEELFDFVTDTLNIYKIKNINSLFFGELIPNINMTKERWEKLNKFKKTNAITINMKILSNDAIWFYANNREYLSDEELQGVTYRLGTDADFFLESYNIAKEQYMKILFGLLKKTKMYIFSQHTAKLLDKIEKAQYFSQQEKLEFIYLLYSPHHGNGAIPRFFKLNKFPTVTESVLNLFKVAETIDREEKFSYIWDYIIEEYGEELSKCSLDELEKISVAAKSKEFDTFVLGWFIKSINPNFKIYFVSNYQESKNPQFFDGICLWPKMFYEGNNTENILKMVSTVDNPQIIENFKILQNKMIEAGIVNEDISFITYQILKNKGLLDEYKYEFKYLLCFLKNQDEIEIETTDPAISYPIEYLKDIVEVQLPQASFFDLGSKYRFTKYFIHLAELYSFSIDYKKESFESAIELIKKHFNIAGTFFKKDSEGEYATDEQKKISETEENLKNMEITRSFIYELHEIFGIEPISKTIKFKSGKDSYQYDYFEINKDLLEQVPTSEQAQQLIDLFTVLKRELPKENVEIYAKIIYTLLKKNQNLSVFKAAEENIKLLDFLFEGFSKAKDDYINEILDKYDITPSQYEELRNKTTLVQYEQQTEETNTAVAKEEVLYFTIENITNQEDRINFLLWLMSSDKDSKYYRTYTLGNIKCKNNDDVVINFDSFRTEFQLMSKTERENVIRTIFLGSNGILNKKESKEKNISEAITGLQNVLFNNLFFADGKVSSLNVAMANMFKKIFEIVFRNISDERKVVFVNNLFSALIDIKNETENSDMEEGELRARQLGRLIVAIGVNSGMAVLKLLQILSNNKVFEKLDDKYGYIINDEVSKVKSENEPLSKFVIFKYLERLGMLDKAEVVGKCLGSASIGLTYLVKFIGKKVFDVVKIKRPNIMKNYEEDFYVFSKIREYVISETSPLPEQYKKMIPKAEHLKNLFNEELNFGTESENLREFSKQLKARNSEILVPDLINDGKFLFTQTSAKGDSLNNLELSVAERKEINFKILKEFFTEVFFDAQSSSAGQALYHADLHAGNIFIDENGNITFIDLGGVGKVDIEKSKSLKKIFIFLCLGNYNGFISSLKEFNRNIPNQLSSANKSKIKEILERKAPLENKFADLFEIFNNLENMDKDFLMFMQSISKIAVYIDELELIGEDGKPNLKDILDYGKKLFNKDLSGIEKFIKENTEFLKKLAVSIYIKNYNGFINALSLYNQNIVEKLSTDEKEQIKNILKSKISLQEKLENLIKILNGLNITDEDFLLFLEIANTIIYYIGEAELKDIITKIFVSKIFTFSSKKQKEIKQTERTHAQSEKDALLEMVLSKCKDISNDKFKALENKLTNINKDAIKMCLRNSIVSLNFNQITTFIDIANYLYEKSFITDKNEQDKINLLFKVVTRFDFNNEQIKELFEIDARFIDEILTIIERESSKRKQKKLLKNFLKEKNKLDLEIMNIEVLKTILDFSDKNNSILAILPSDIAKKLLNDTKKLKLMMGFLNDGNDRELDLSLIVKLIDLPNEILEILSNNRYSNESDYMYNLHKFCDLYDKCYDENKFYNIHKFVLALLNFTTVKYRDTSSRYYKFQNKIKNLGILISWKTPILNKFIKFINAHKSLTAKDKQTVNVFKETVDIKTLEELSKTVYRLKLKTILNEAHKLNIPISIDEVKFRILLRCVEKGIGITSEVRTKIANTTDFNEFKKYADNLLSNKKKKLERFGFLDRNAYIWEEIIFKVIPIVISAFNPIIGFYIFVSSQIFFILAHFIPKLLGGKKLNDAFVETKELIFSLPTLISFTFTLLMGINTLIFELGSSFHHIIIPIVLAGLSIPSIIIHRQYNEDHISNPLSIAKNILETMQKESNSESDSIPVSLFGRNENFNQQEMEVLEQDTDAKGYMEVFLDDDIVTTKQKILEAAKTNKIIVLHMFRDISEIQKKSLYEIYLEITRNLAKCFSNDYGLNEIFPNMTQKEEDYQGFRYGYNFFLVEIIKNVLVHGYKGLIDQPIGISIKLNDNEEVEDISVYSRNIPTTDEKQEEERLSATKHGKLNGYGLGHKYMEYSYLRNYEEIPDFANGKFFKVKSTQYKFIDQTKKDIFEEFSEIMANAHRRGLAIISENISIVNKILQTKFGNSLIAAIIIAFKEFKASLKPNFVDLHQNEAGKQGASELRKFITGYDIVETDSTATRIIKAIIGTIIKGASIVKHVTIDYRFIKSSGISEAIKMFGNSTYMDDNGNVHIPPVMIVDNLEQLQDKYELRNTGIKVNGRSIYQVGEKGTLIYGAQGIDGIDISKAINESQMIKDAIENMIRAKGYEGIKVEVEGVIQEEGEGVRFEDGITIIGNLELQNKSADYINGFVSSSLEIKRSMGVMYSQKALISLESIEDKEKLEQAIKQGRARKIISKSQYEQIQLTPEEIITMRENGIEIYIDDNETDESLKESGIIGQIIRKDGQIFIHDYYAQEEVEVEEIGEEDTLLNIEDKLVNSQKPILIDIKVLAKKFQKENILGVYKGLNTLIGNIKIRTGIGSISQTDVENLAYNIDYNKIPDLGTLSKEKIETLSIDELIELLNIAENSEIRIILKAIRKNVNLDEDGFVNIIKGRILAKTALEENNKEYGLKDKQMEILLGKMLLKQLGNKDKQTVNIANDFTGEKDRVMKKIMEETEKANKGEEAAINTIIEIILVYGDSYKNKQMARELDKNDARNYRAMMAAA